MTDEPHLISRAAESHMQATFARIRAHHDMPPHVTDQQLLDILDSHGGRYAIQIDHPAFARLAEHERAIADAARAKKAVATVDLTPTWTSILPILITLIEEGRNTTLAKDELARMAKLADLYVASQRPRAPVEPHENIGSL